MASDQPSKALKVFIDSSVLIAAAISATGAARELILRGLCRQLTLVISTFTLDETRRNLSRKAPAALPAFELFQALLSEAIGDPPTELVVQVARTVEPKDAPIVAGALHSRADYLVSFDRRHLLSQAAEIQAVFGLQVTTPDEVLSAVRRVQPSRPQGPPDTI